MSVPVPTVKTLPSGAKLEIKHLPFKERHDLFKAIARSLLGIKLDVRFSTKDFSDLAKMTEADAPINDLKNLICRIISDDEIQGFVDVLLGRCLMNGVVINAPQSFENTPEDYIPAAQEVARIAISPFSQSLLSAFTSAQSASSASQK